MNVGKCEWFIPDAFYPEKDNGDYVSHEAVCVLNTGKTEARIDFTLYFEDRPPMGGFSAVCPAERTHHVRLDRIRSEAGGAIPRGVPYAIYSTAGAIRRSRNWLLWGCLLIDRPSVLL